MPRGITEIGQSKDLGNGVFLSAWPHEAKTLGVDLGFLIKHRKEIADDAAESLKRLSDDYARRFDGK